MADYRSQIDKQIDANGNVPDKIQQLADFLKQSQQFQATQQNAADRQTQNENFQTADDQRKRQADVDTVTKLRGMVGKDAKISTGHVTIDPREVGQVPLTPGQEAADKTFGKEYADYQAGGGKAGTDKNIRSVEGAIQGIQSLDKYDRAAGFLPKVLRDVVAPKSVAVEDSIKGAIQQTLRQTLGAQFTEKEGELLMNRAYNPRLSAEENIKRATAIANQLKQQAAQKQQSARMFERTGSLKGLNTTGQAMPATYAPQAPNDDAEMQEYLMLKQKHGK